MNTIKSFHTKVNAWQLFLLKMFYPSKYKLIQYTQEEIDGLKQFSNQSKAFIDPNNKNKIDNLKTIYTFYLKHKKNGRTIVVKADSWREVKDKYGEEYLFIEPMIKDVSGWWSDDGEYHNE